LTLPAICGIIKEKEKNLASCAEIPAVETASRYLLYEGENGKLPVGR